MEYISLSSKDFVSKLTASVKEGSLVPDSDNDRANESSKLLSEGNMDPITAFDRMGLSNPKETAERLYKWKADPTLLFPEIGAQIEAKAKQQQLDQIAMQGIAPK